MSADKDKKTLWELDVRRDSSLKVVFADLVTADEAKTLYDDADFVDVIDEEDHGYEIVGIRQQGGGNYGGANAAGFFQLAL